MFFKRPPDFIIGEVSAPYLKRWWAIPRNKWFNIYWHEILKGDDDRARHDHPWWNLSIILRGGYWEDTPTGTKWRGAGAFILRPATALHILRLEPGQKKSTISLFITGPIIREWGFACPKGWRHWKDFVAGGEKGKVGKGCND